MKKVTSILSAGAFVFATVAAIGGNMFVTSGWGKFPTHTILRTINDSADCSTTANGEVCTVTDNVSNPTTVNAYDSQSNANAGGSIGLLKRI